MSADCDPSTVVMMLLWPAYDCFCPHSAISEKPTPAPNSSKYSNAKTKQWTSMPGTRGPYISPPTPFTAHHHHLFTTYIHSTLIQSDQIVHHSPNSLGGFTVPFFACTFPSAPDTWKSSIHSARPNSNGFSSVKPFPVCPHETFVILPQGSQPAYFKWWGKLLLFTPQQQPNHLEGGVLSRILYFSE